jgi:hypothetical protein
MTTEKDIIKSENTSLQLQKEKKLKIEEINALVEKYKNIKPKATIIGKEPYEPFLAGIEDDTWMSVGDEIKED